MKYLWGIGREAKKLLENHYISIKEFDGIIDLRGGKYREGGDSIRIIRPDEIVFHEEDIVLVVVLADDLKKEIYQQAKEHGLSDQQIVFLYNAIDYHGSIYTEIHRQNENIIKKYWPAIYELSVKNSQKKYKRNIYTRRCTFDLEDINSLYDRKPYATNTIYQLDYIRYRTLELCATEIKRKGLSGKTAEAGVFRGDFSRYIHAIFPEKMHIMYDTFESFDRNEFEREIAAGNCTEEMYGAFKNTDIDRSLLAFENPENCIIRKGYFPDTVTNEDENSEFCFVSLDMDLEEPMYNGLAFFYPRMIEGGYIFMHDYNNKDLCGVKKAVNRYSSEHSGLKMVPICDEGGTLVVCK